MTETKIGIVFEPAYSGREDYAGRHIIGSIDIQDVVDAFIDKNKEAIKRTTAEVFYEINLPELLRKHIKVAVNEKLMELIFDQLNHIIPKLLELEFGPNRETIEKRIQNMLTRMITGRGSR